MVRGSAAYGYTLIELLMAIALVTILAAAAVPTGLSQIEAHRLDGATRYLAALCVAARSEAVRRSAFVAIRFETDAAAGDRAFRTYLDGNRNGVRTRDITSGIDRPLRHPDHLGDHFAGVRFGVAAGLTGIDPGETLAEGDDPIRIGATDLLSFNPNGSVTAGTIYLRSDHGQRAIRLLGATGRTRILSFVLSERRWIEY